MEKRAGTFASSRYRCRNLDPLLYARDQATIETKDFSRRICFEEGKDGPTDRNGHGYEFWGFEGNIPYGLFRERTHNHDAVLQ